MARAAAPRDGAGRVRTLEEQVRRLRTRTQASGTGIEFLDLSAYLAEAGWQGHDARLVCQRWSDGSGLVWGEGYAESLQGEWDLWYGNRLPIGWRPKEFTIVPLLVLGHLSTGQPTLEERYQRPRLLGIETGNGKATFRVDYEPPHFHEAFAFYGLEYGDSGPYTGNAIWPTNADNVPLSVRKGATAVLPMVEIRGDENQYGRLETAGFRASFSTDGAAYPTLAGSGAGDLRNYTFVAYLPPESGNNNYIGFFLRADDENCYVVRFYRFTSPTNGFVRRQIVQQFGDPAKPEVVLSTFSQIYDEEDPYIVTASVESYYEQIPNTGLVQRVRVNVGGTFTVGTRTQAQGFCYGDVQGFVGNVGEIREARPNRVLQQVNNGYPPESTVVALNGLTWDAAQPGYVPMP